MRKLLKKCICLSPDLFEKVMQYVEEQNKLYPDNVPQLTFSSMVRIALRTYMEKK